MALTPANWSQLVRQFALELLSDPPGSPRGVGLNSKNHTLAFQTRRKAYLSHKQKLERQTRYSERCRGNSRYQINGGESRLTGIRSRAKLGPL